MKKRPTVYDRLRWAYSQPLLSTPQAAVLINLVYHANPAGECWPAIRTIAAEIGSNHDTVTRAISTLTILGLIEVRRRGGMGSGKGRGRGSNRYLLHYDRVAIERPNSGRLNQVAGTDSGRLNQEGHDLIQSVLRPDSGSLNGSNHRSTFHSSVSTEIGDFGGLDENLTLQEFLARGGRLDD